MKFILVVMLGLLAGLTGAPAAHAEDGLLNALSIRPLPDDKNIQVQTLDDSDENLQLAAEISKQLEAKGYTISKTAELILNFETRDQIGEWDSGPDRHVLSLEAHGGGTGGETQKARVNVFDSSTGGLLNKGANDKGPSLKASKYRLEMTVETRSDGKTLWRGWTVADLNAGAGPELTKKMIAPLVQALGETVRSQSFPTE